MLKTTRILILAMLSIAAIFSMAFCANSDTTKARTAFVTILPLKNIVQRIAGDRFEVHSFVGSGQSPHDFTPTPSQLAGLSKASLYFRIGVESEEGFMPKISKTMPTLTIVDLRDGIQLRELTEEHNHEYADDKHHDSDHNKSVHAGKDPHVWLSPVLMKRISLTAKDALVRKDPSGKTLYENNLKALLDDLDTLDGFLRNLLTPYKGTFLFVFHPAFGYFAEEYGLIQKAVETGGKEPSAQALARLIDDAREHNPKVIFVQPQYSQKSARAIAAQIRCAVVPIDPLPENYFDVIRTMGKDIQQALNRQ